MISFTIRYDEATSLWQYQPAGQTRWSEPMRYGKVMSAVAREVRRESLEESGAVDDINKRWSMPLPHQVKSRKSEREKLQELYEIRGGKVQKIGYTERERTAQQADEILAALGEIEL